MDFYKVLFARKTGGFLPSTDHPDFFAAALGKRLGGGYIIKTVKDLIASFSDCIGGKAKSVVCDIVPSQSGSGTPSPDNVRPISGWTATDVNVCGINVWDEEWEKGYISSGNNASSNNCIRSKNYIPIIPNTQYYFRSAFTTYNKRFVISYYDENKAYISGAVTYAQNEVFTTPSKAWYMRFYSNDAYGNTYNHDISINYPSTDTDYHAYSGQTYEVNWGKNLFVKPYKEDRTTILGVDVTQHADGSVTFDGTVNGGTMFFNFGGTNYNELTFKAGTYTLSGGNSRFKITIVKDGSYYVATSTATGKVTFTLTEDAKIYFYGSAINGTVFDNETIYPMIELGSTASDYTPYAGGTIYGGTVDAVSGVVTVTHAMLTLNTSTMDNSESHPGWKKSGIANIVGDGVNAFFTSLLNIGTKFGVNTVNGNDILFLPTATYGKTQSEWIALAMDIQIVAELATPLTYQLTPQQIALLKGANNVWNSIDETEVVYKAKVTS